MVTVLFADLVGFTARAERLDPEDVRALLAPYYAHLRAELERFGGTVEKFIGDAVMAVFGAPVAHEDDPERAVRAALAIREWAVEQGDALQVRIAVTTGEALVTLAARPSEGEGMVAGDVVSTAARLQAAAPLNGILVGAQTRRASADAIEYREVDPVTAKGKREPVRAWEALQARARLGVDASPRAVAPLVGRGRELELVVAALGRVREESAPQLVTLVGVPGIGKSRLIYELFRAVEAERDFVTWRQGRSLPYGEGVTFWALAEIVKAQAGVLETDSAEQAEAKLARAVTLVAADDAESQRLTRHLRPLVGLADEAPGGPEEGAAAWRRFLEAIAETGPAVLVFEDLHWADDALLDFVDDLVDRARGVPLLVLGTARPELLERRRGWGGGKPNALTVSLSPLSDEETARLVGELVDWSRLDGPTREALLARAGGNPLYAEQYARAVAERGDIPRLPETVQGIIAARLDAVSGPEKRLLQDAAVVGKVFWLGAVQVIGDVPRWQAEEVLHALERKEFVQRSRGSSVASETEYAFRHMLIRDVAYGQIPRSARCDKHLRVAAWIESLGRPEDQAEMLAHHHLRALELAEAAGLDPSALGDSARIALRDAGDRAAALYAAEAAERFYSAALRLWPADDPERAVLLFRCAAPIATWGGADDPERLAEAADALREAGDVTRAAEAEMVLSGTWWIHGRRDLADLHAARALELVRRAPPSRSTAWVLSRQASRASLSGDHGRALQLSLEARTLSERLGWDDGVTAALAQHGWSRVALGDRDGLADIMRAIELGKSVGALATLSNAYNSLSVALQILGDLDAGYAARLEGAQVAAMLGSESQGRWFQGVLVDHRYRHGDWDEALREADDFVAAVDAGSPHYLAFQVLSVRAELRLARDDTGGAVADAMRALAEGRRIGEVQAVYFALPVAVHVLAVAGDRRAAELAREHLDFLLRSVEVQFAVINLPAFASAALRLGLADRLRDALAGHRDTPWTTAVRAYVDGDLSAAADVLHRIGARPEEADARLGSAQRLVAARRREDAEAELRAARAFYTAVGATRYLRECDELVVATAKSW